MKAYEIADLQKGLTLATNKRHDIKIKVHTLNVRLAVPPVKAGRQDHRFILMETRPDGQYRQTLIVREDHVPADRHVELAFRYLKPGCVYDLTVESGRDEPYYFFKQMPFNELFA